MEEEQGKGQHSEARSPKNFVDHALEKMDGLGQAIIDNDNRVRAIVISKIQTLCSADLPESIDNIPSDNLVHLLVNYYQHKLKSQEELYHEELQKVKEHSRESIKQLMRMERQYKWALEEAWQDRDRELEYYKSQVQELVAITQESINRGLNVEQQLAEVLQEMERLNAQKEVVGMKVSSTTNLVTEDSEKVQQLRTRLEELSNQSAHRVAELMREIEMEREASKKIKLSLQHRQEQLQEKDSVIGQLRVEIQSLKNTISAVQERNRIKEQEAQKVKSVESVSIRVIAPEHKSKLAEAVQQARTQKQKVEHVLTQFRNQFKTTNQQFISKFQSMLSALEEKEQKHRRIENDLKQKLENYDLRVMQVKAGQSHLVNFAMTRREKSYAMGYGNMLANTSTD